VWSVTVDRMSRVHPRGVGFKNHVGSRRRVIGGPERVAEFGQVGFMRADLVFAGSQPDHAFPETGGYVRSQEDTRAAAIEFRRTVKESAGHVRIRRRHG
jgi:hypothetical protein